jgi:hypothetical protein
MTQIPSIDSGAAENDPLPGTDDSAPITGTDDPGSANVRNNLGEENVARLDNLFGGSNLASQANLGSTRVVCRDAVKVEVFIWKG